MTTIYPNVKSSQPSNRLYDIPALEDDGSNFQSWKFRARTVLTMRNLMPHVEGKAVDPGPGNKFEHEEFLRANQEALAQITLTLKDEPLNGVLYCETTKEAWDKLHD